MPRFRTSKLSDLAGPGGRSVVYLLDVVGGLEERMLEDWIRRETGSRGETIRIASSRRGRGGDVELLTSRLGQGDDPWVIPLRVVWMAPERHGRRSVGWSDILKPGDPRDPLPLRSRWIKTFRPDRVVLMSGIAAGASTLVEEHDRGMEVDGLANFVTRRAWRSLDQGERTLRGNRYKVPRFVHETILSRKSFVDAVHGCSEVSGESPEAAMKKAAAYLREIAATHSPYVIDLIANAIHYLYRQGYGRIDYRPDQVAAVAELGQSNPLVFLPAHRSNLDRLSTQFLLWENDLPPNHTAGGINLNFFPVGPLMRRTGVFFIRRSFKENELYKIVLRSYIDFLVEKRFPLEWYLEGGRSRSGKLGPPRFGLLQYVAGALEREKAEDIMIVPVSIVYDQIQDVPDYTREAQGRGKEKESLRWMVKAIRSLRRRYGNIHVRFGEPISMAAMLSNDRHGIQKLAFEVMHRIGLATPITPLALVSIALLEARGKALTSTELAKSCGGLVDFVRARGLEMTEVVDLSDPETVTGALQWLAEHGAVSSHEAIGRTVYWLDDEQMIQVSYYRNVVVHFFVPRAIAEIALTSAPGRGDERAAVDAAVMAVRDLLKFEFFFADRDAFLAEIDADIALDMPDWNRVLRDEGGEAVANGLGRRVAGWALLPFLDAYQVVGDELEELVGPYNEKQFLKACLARARMYRIEGRLASGESASQVLFKSALALAANRELLSDDRAPGRAAFAAEVREARRLAAENL
jgi:glycerol-3-phosphate O-acyltransferase